MKKFLFLLLLSTLASGAYAQTESPKTAVKDSVIINLTDYAGTYKFTETFSQATVLVKDGLLFGEVDSYGSNKLLPQTDADTYKSTSSYGTVFVFKRDDAKKVIALTLKLMGQELTGDKEKN